MANKYYTASSDIIGMFVKGENHGYTSPTLQEATERARIKMVKDGLEWVGIVRIVRILRKAEPPIIIEDVEDTESKPLPTHACPHYGNHILSYYNDVYIPGRVHYRCNQCGHKHYIDTRERCPGETPKTKLHIRTDGNVGIG
jgi:hypothetical protein